MLIFFICPFRDISPARQPAHILPVPVPRCRVFFSPVLFPPPAGPAGIPIPSEKEKIQKNVLVSIPYPQSKFFFFWEKKTEKGFEQRPKLKFLFAHRTIKAMFV